MIRNYRLLGIIGIVCCYATLLYPLDANDNVRKLKKAIDNSDTETVTALIKKEGVFTRETREKLLEQAEEKVAYYEDNRSLWTSKKDIAQILGGIVLSIAGLGSAAFGAFSFFHNRGAYQWRPDPEEMHFLLGGISLLVGGLVFIKNGYACTGAAQLLKQSEEVFDNMEKAPIQEPLPVQESLEEEHY